MNKPTLKEVDRYPTPSFLADRIASEHGYTKQQAENLVLEAKRMLYISAYTMESTAPSEKIDDAWHEMLMFTKWYREFCSFIGAFIHHEPTPPQEKITYQKEARASGDKEKQKETPTYTKTKKLYEKIIGLKPNPSYWP